MDLRKLCLMLGTALTVAQAAYGQQIVAQVKVHNPTGDVTKADGYTWVDCPPPRADAKVFVMPYGSVFLDRLNEMTGNRGLVARSSEQLRNWSYSLWLAQGGRTPSK